MEREENIMKFEVLKGTRDYLPKEQIKINFVLDTIRKNFEKYGFRPFDTPMIEYLETLTNKYEEDAEIVGEIFKVTDRGERKLGLRYDLTIPFCRFIASQKQLKLPFKRYAVGKVFRDGPIKPGRLREFIQCDADIVGVRGQEVEAETLKMFFDTYTELGIKSVLEINNFKILQGVFLQVGFKEKDLESVIQSVDKLKKIGEKGVLVEIKDKKLNSKKVKEGIAILESKNFKDMRKKASLDVLKEGIDELENLTKLLKSFKVNFKVNFTMARGLNYYTGNVWEMYEANGKIGSSIGSGGRYDKGIGNYIDDGKEYPAFGVSFGLIPILECLDVKYEKECLTDILVAPLSESVILSALKIAESLRSIGLKVEICYDYKLKKAFSYAESLGINELAIVGEKDLAEGVYTMRNLITKKEKKINFKS